MTNSRYLARGFEITNVRLDGGTPVGAVPSPGKT
ncbi:outer membrane receptor for ferric coprogen and ferric-rhodotorulic acid [Pseudomonas sp. JUb96]|jgi:outer membrane receptor for ferric coprogen and ferric-rhodotorulic acid|nr:outer membrane receptor for ferric coprogen and ferric-rhodotorulic acid [Pseudomonas sp. JUb96]